MLRKSYKYLLTKITKELDEELLKQSAIIFAPHQDDETLGCGGTIFQKRRRNAEIKIVFMTDGCRSHAHFMSEEELKSIRAEEALAAAQILGLSSQDVILLGFKDGQLHKHQAEAIERVTEILQEYQPKQVFIPYYREAPLDHFYTNQIILAALAKTHRQVTVYEYPVWYWYHWPWTGISGSRREQLDCLKTTIKYSFGFQLLKDFRDRVFIGDVLENKRRALAQHKSQMEKLLPDTAWATLGDIAKGEWLACFFQDYEVFYRYQVKEKRL
jgi:LmbE family N-acetylglucosaminyl deacetylase